MDEASDEISSLIETLHRTEQRLEHLTAGQIDSVSDASGRTFLLRRAQEQLRQDESARQATILNALPAHIALLDAKGFIVSVNQSWRRFALENGSRTLDLDLTLTICWFAIPRGGKTPWRARAWPRASARFSITGVTDIPSSTLAVHSGFCSV